MSAYFNTSVVYKRLFCKKVLRVKNNTGNVAVSGKLGRYPPLYVEKHSRMVTYSGNKLSFIYIEYIRYLGHTLKRPLVLILYGFRKYQIISECGFYGIWEHNSGVNPELIEITGVMELIISNTWLFIGW